MKLKSESASPGKAFFFGKRKATYRYSIAGNEPRNLKIQAVNKELARRRTWKKSRIEPGKVHRIRWAGTGKHDRPAPRRHLCVQGPHPPWRQREVGAVKGDDRSFALSPTSSRLRARAHLRRRLRRAGNGHVHQGQDILAPCGKRLVAARGGRVQYRGYQASGAGYYLVVDGKGTGHDYVYMHLRPRRPPEAGQRVRTGQPIGTVGETGDASGCHLHFEMWTKPGWYEGGKRCPP